MSASPEPARPVRLGLGANLPQFCLLVVVSAFVGAMVGMERSILPTIAKLEFQLAPRTAILSFIVVFVARVLAHLPETPPNFSRIVALNEAGDTPDDLTTLEAGANRCAVA